MSLFSRNAQLSDEGGPVAQHTNQHSPHALPSTSQSVSNLHPSSADVLHWTDGKDVVKIEEGGLLLQDVQRADTAENAVALSLSPDLFDMADIGKV